MRLKNAKEEQVEEETPRLNGGVHAELKSSEKARGLLGKNHRPFQGVQPAVSAKHE